MTTTDFASQIRRPSSIEANSAQLSNFIRLTSILVVEDDLPVASIIVTILQTAGYSVHMVDDAAEAVEYLVNNDSALVILDLARMGREGLELIEKLRTVQPQVPLLAIFSRQNPAIAAEALKAGLADFVTQPLDLGALAFRIRVLLAQRHLSAGSDLEIQGVSRIFGDIAPAILPSTPALANVAQPSITATRDTALVASEAAVPPLAIYCFGRFRMLVNGTLVCDDSSGGRRAVMLLKYMIANLGRRVLKERVADLLWPDLSGDLASNNLRGTIHSLRQQLASVGLDPNEYIHTERGSLYFDPGDDYYYDVEDFTSKLEQANSADRAGHWGEAITRYEEASRVYKGAYLESDEGVEWVIYEQESMKERFMSALIRLADLYIETERYEEAIATAQRVIHEDWRREAAHRILMVGFYKSGQRTHALIAYQNLVDTFKENLGISPMQQTRDLAARILREEKV